MIRTEQETLDLCKQIFNDFSDKQKLDWLKESGHYWPNDIAKKEKEIAEREELLDFFEIREFEYIEGEDDKYKLTSEIDQKWGEGEWEIYYFISEILVKETGEKIFIKFEWRYSSWDSTEWETVSIVEPKEVQVIQYINKYND